MDDNKQTKRLNFVFFLVDQMRADCFGKAGHDLVKTPNLDKLCEEGIMFSNAFSPSPICVPARSQIMTGRWGHETGNRWGNSSWCYRTNTPLADNNGVILDPEVTTLPEILTLEGYMTAAIGKCHYYPRDNMYGFLYRENGQSTGKYINNNDCYWKYLDEAGYDSLHMDSFGAPTGYHDKRPGEEEVCRIVPYITQMPAEHQFTTWCGKRAIKFLEDKTVDRPFFLQIGFHAPHDPYCVSKPYDQLYDWQDIELPEQPEDITQFPSWLYNGEKYGKIDPQNPELSEEEMKKNWAYYLANITFIDEQIGKVVNYLKKTNQYNNTFFIFTSDHGDHMGQHYSYGKSTMMEESIHIPLVIAGQPVKRRGKSDQLVTLMDLYPTILNLIDLNLFEMPDDLRDAYTINLTNDDILDNDDNRKNVFGELGEGEDRQYMVRSKTHKYIYHPAQKEEEFFNLIEDPGELKNLAVLPEYKNDNMKEKLKQELFDWLNRESNYCYSGREYKAQM